MARDPRPNPSAHNLSRRRLVQGLAVAGASAILPRAVGAEPDGLTVPPWTRQQGRPTGKPYGTPSPYEAGVRRILPAQPSIPALGTSNSFTPLQDLHGFITPNGLFYERHHAGVPTIDPNEHRLVVHGLVERDFLFTLDDILRFPAVCQFHFLECSGNSDTCWTPDANETVQMTHGLLSCCQWTGVPLRYLLAETGLRSGAKWVIAQGADASVMARSIPLSKILDDALVCYAQNGERLRPEQGYPLRLLLPGWEGNTNIKWLRSLHVTDVPHQTREETSKYTDLLPNGRARQFTFVMEAKSVITWPSAGQRITDRGPQELRGLAWSGLGRVKKVDVTFDGGRNWQPAVLDQPVLPKCLTSFRLPWKWDGSTKVIASRVTDDSGYVQPTHKQLVDERGRNSEYHYNGIHACLVRADGAVEGVLENVRQAI